MNKLIRIGSIQFAIALVSLGILQVIHKDFVVGRPDPWPASVPGKMIWVYVTAGLLIITGLCFLIKRLVAQSAILMALIVLIYSFFFRHFAAMIGNPPEAILWSVNAFKTLALCASIIIAGGAIVSGQRPATRFIRSDFIQWLSLILLAYFFVLCGFAHFKFFDFVNTLVPSFLPAHGFWTTLAGIALIGTGIGILSPYSRRPAAFAAGCMLLFWVFLVHLPRSISSHDDLEWMGVFEAFGLSGALFVIAGIAGIRQSAYSRI